MRLLDARTKKLCEFDEADLPPYAILSHTWQKGEELLYHEVESLLEVESDDENKDCQRGLWKIRHACAQALEDGYDYVWIDTCCIDKSSSAELSEAINSMFRWYAESRVCYVYLCDYTHAQCIADLEAVTTWRNNFQNWMDELLKWHARDGDFEATKESIITELSDYTHSVQEPAVPSFSIMRKTRWLRRGWTLQELVAPKHVKFYASSWEYCFSKDDVADVLAGVTGIPAGVLKGDVDFRTQSQARRLSWAARRETTRIEDQAYCLLGLCEVNMPLLYGEGKMAFIRLQEEIVSRSADHSLFAWGLPRHMVKHHFEEAEDTDSNADESKSRSGHDSKVKFKEHVPETSLETYGPSGWNGMFAPSPLCFRHSGRIVSHGTSGLKPFAVTNKGIQIELPLTRSQKITALLRKAASGTSDALTPETPFPDPERLHYACLPCYCEQADVDGNIIIPLLRMGQNQYERVPYSVLQPFNMNVLYLSPLWDDMLPLAQQCWVRRDGFGPEQEPRASSEARILHAPALNDCVKVYTPSRPKIASGNWQKPHLNEIRAGGQQWVYVMIKSPNDSGSIVGLQVFTGLIEPGSKSCPMLSSAQLRGHDWECENPRLPFAAARAVRASDVNDSALMCRVALDTLIDLTVTFYREPITSHRERLFYAVRFDIQKSADSSIGQLTFALNRLYRKGCHWIADQKSGIEQDFEPYRSENAKALNAAGGALLMSQLTMLAMAYAIIPKEYTFFSICMQGYAYVLLVVLFGVGIVWTNAVPCPGQRSTSSAQWWGRNDGS